jgi:hypothetical protein
MMDGKVRGFAEKKSTGTERQVFRIRGEGNNQWKDMGNSKKNFSALCHMGHMPFMIT